MDPSDEQRPAAFDGSVVLNGPEEWYSWIAQVRLVAEYYGIWAEINPAETLGIRPVPPIDPAPYKPLLPLLGADGSVAPAALTTFKERNELYQAVNKEWQEWQTRHRAVYKIINKLVSKELKDQVPLYTTDPSLLSLLKALRTITGGDDPQRLYEIEESWRSLATKQRCLSTDLIQWLGELRVQFVRLGEVGSTIAAGFTPHLGILNVLREAGYEVTTFLREIRTSISLPPAQQLVSLAVETNKFPRYLTDLSVLLQPKRIQKRGHAAAVDQASSSSTAATPSFQGKDDKGNKINERSKEKKLTVLRTTQGVQDAAKKWLKDNQSKAKEIFKKADELSTNPTSSFEDSGTAFAIHTINAASKPAAKDPELRDCVIADTGASIHICNDWDRYESAEKLPQLFHLIAGGQEITLHYAGVMKVLMRNGTGQLELIRAKQAYYFPDHHTSLLSNQLMEDKGYYLDSERSRYFNRIKNHELKFTKLLGLIIFEHEKPTNNSNPPPPSIAATIRRTTNAASPTRWHERLGHPGSDMMKQLAVEDPERRGVKMIGSELPTPTSCKVCGETKTHRQEWTNQQPLRYSAPFAHTCWDLFDWGPALGRSGKKLAIRLCPITKMVIGGIPSSESSHALWKEILFFDVFLQRRYNLLLRAIQCDNQSGLLGAWNAREPVTYFSQHGINVISTSPDTPHENPAERTGGTVDRLSRQIFVDSGLPQNLWPWVTNYLAIFILNRLPKRALNWRAPLQVFNEWLRVNRAEIFTNIDAGPPNLSFLRRPGCRAFALITKQKNTATKAEPSSHIGYLVGYKSSSQYYIWIPQLKRVINTPHVRFDETRVYRDDAEAESLKLPTAILALTIEQLIDETDSEAQEEQELSQYHLQLGTINELYTDDAVVPTNYRTYAATGAEREQQQEGLFTPEATPERSSKQATAEASTSSAPVPRKSAAPKTVVPSSLSKVSADLDPRNIAEKTTDPEPLETIPRGHYELRFHQAGQAYIAAEQLELRTLAERNVYTEVPAEEAYHNGKKAIETILVYTHPSPERYKARLCVRGDQQLDEGLFTYAATLAASTYRILLAIANKFALLILQFDFVAAFTNSPLDELVYTKGPPGYATRGTIWKLQKALYGLRRSPLLWYRTLRASFQQLGLTPITEDSCVATNGKITAFWHVDDLNLMYHPHDEAEALTIIQQLRAQFEMTGGSPITNFLKVTLYRDLTKRKLVLCQQAYIAKVAQRLPVEKKLFVTVPLPSATLPMMNKAIPTPEAEKKLYLSKIGSALYAAIMTRPDALYAAAHLATFSSNPAREHMAAADHLLAYLYKTQWLGISFDGDSDELLAYSDASFADNADRRSSEGQIMTLFGGPITWKSGKQRCVTTSSTEAEIRALSDAAGQLMSLERLFEQIGLDLPDALALFCDNVQSVRLLDNEIEGLTTRLRHIDIHGMWLRQVVTSGSLRVKWISADGMLADGLTKRLDEMKHAAFIRDLGLIDCATFGFSCR